MEQMIEYNGARLLVADDGEGPPVVLVHAGIADHHAWDPVVPGLLAAGYRVVRYDTRGWGRSETAPVEFSNRADLVAVLDSLGIERAALVGNSRGGNIAGDTAMEFPERTHALVLVAATVGGWEGPATPEEAAAYAEMERLQEADPPDPDAIVAHDLAVWVDGVGQPAGRAPTAIRDAVAAWDRAIAEPGRVFGTPIRLDPTALERLDSFSRLVLVVSGALDVSDTRAAGELLVERIGARHVVVPEVAHLVAMENPAAFVAILDEFLAPLRPWS